MARHDIAQICINGHVVNDSFGRYPEFNKNYCDKCGEPTITKCPKCNSEIQGHFYAEGVISAYVMEEPPKFCHNCGKPYPWTELKIKAAEELAKEIESLNEEEKESLVKSIDDLVHDSPKTELAVFRFKKIAAKAGKEATEALKKILIDIVSETVKKAIWS